MYETVLVPTNGSDEAALAEEYAVEVAARFDSEAHALFVAEAEGTPISSDLSPEAIERLFLEVRDHPASSFLEAASEHGVPATTATRVGYPADAILEFADEIGVDLVVVGAHGRSGISRYLLGSTTERTIREGELPVLAVQRPG